MEDEENKDKDGQQLGLGGEGGQSVRDYAEDEETKNRL